jgi:flagellar biosynthesis protein FliQ
MTPDFVMGRLQEMLTLAVVISAPVLCAGMAVGILVAIFQAATQLQETSLSFVPKLLAIGATLLATGPWALDKLIGMTQSTFHDMASVLTLVH